MEQEKFYPTISSLIGLDDLPSELSFLKDVFGGLLDSTFFTEFRHSKSGAGGLSFYSLKLLRYGTFTIPVPGTGIEIQFGTFTGGNVTAIPLTLSYRWPILDLIKNFSLASFTDEPLQLFALIAKKFDIDVEKVVNHAVLRFAQTPGDVASFVLQAAQKYSVTIQPPQSGTFEQQLEQAIADIEDIVQRPIIEVVYALYLAPIGSLTEALRRIEHLFQDVFNGPSIVAYIKDLITPFIDASLHVDVGITFPRDILQPMILRNNVYVVDSDTSHKVELLLGGVDCYFGTRRGFGFSAIPDVGLPPAMIGNTGLIISFSKLRVDLSTTTNIPEAAADGRGPEFVGVYVGSAEITLPSFWKKKPGSTTTIKARNVLIGTGGLSGTFALDGGGGAPLLETTFGGTDDSPLEPGHPGFDVVLSRFDIRFHQGAIVDSHIVGKVRLPGLKLKKPALGPGHEYDHNDFPEIDVSITIDEHGFSVSADLEKLGDAVTIGIKDVFDFTFRKLEIGKKDDRWFAAIAGKLDIIAEVPVVGRFIKEPVDIQKLVIWSNGEFDFEGGSLVLPKISPLKLGPVELSVTALHFGRDKQELNGVMRQYKVIGFDGGVKTGAGGLDARGEGIKFYFTTDGGAFDSFLRIETIRIDLRIPGDATPESAALLLKGYVSMKNPSNDAQSTGDHSRLTEYAGGITFSMPKMKFGGGAEMRMIPSIGAFFVDANVELSTPILLGSTGLGIYGFRGLFGKKYVLQKPETETWWEFYKKEKLGINAPKFTQAEGFSIGAGASIGTAVDGGTTFSSKLFFMVTVPAAFFLEGQAAILSQRIGLDTTSDPPFYAVLAVKPDEGVMAGFGAHLKVPQDTGDVLTLDASVEMAFFFGRSSAWYINVGQDQPETKRIRATILKILDGWAYFMLASSGIKIGSGVEWKFEQDCGIAKVGLGASLEFGGRVSFKPAQVGGWVILQGYAELRVFGIGFRLSVRASLAAEAPKPFIISGSFELSLSTPWPLPDIHVSVSLSWHFNDTFDESEIGMIEWPGAAAAGSNPFAENLKLPIRATHMLTGESFPVNTICDGDLSMALGTISEAAALPTPPAYNDSRWLGAFDNVTIPIDSYIDIDFTKPVATFGTRDSVKQIGAPPTSAVNDELVPPQKGNSAQVHHTYTIDDFTVFTSPTQGASQWTEFHMVDASTPIVEMVAQELGGTGPAYQAAHDELATKLKLGFWQLTQGDHYTKLRLLARTPLQMSNGTILSELGFPPTVLRCPPAPRPKVCQDWLTTSLHTYTAGTVERDRRLRILVHDDDPDSGPAAAVVAEPVAPHNYARAIRFQSDQQLEILFTEPVSQVDLLLSTLSERLVISYYRGYAYVPGPVQLSATGRPVDQWSASPATSGTAPAQDDMWDRLRAIPSITRAFCTGGEPSGSQPSVSTLTTVMSKKFYKTNVYLRRQWGMTPPKLKPTFCERLRECLEVVTVALAGKDRLPRYLRQNTDNFYRDGKRNAERYIQALEAAGAVIPEPAAAQNRFYDKWLDLLACIGKAYDRRGTLPASMQDVLRQLDMEMERLYGRAKQDNVLRGLALNQPADTADPTARLRMVIEYFTILSLNLDAASLTQSTIDTFEPYYSRLDPIVARLRTALASRSLSFCAATSAAAIPSGAGTPGMPVSTGTSCDRLKRLYVITSALTAPSAPKATAASTPIITAITALIAGFDTTVNEIEDQFGWAHTSKNNVLAHDLARAVRVVAMAWSVIDDMPGTIRASVNDFYGKLEKLVADYREAVEDLDPPQPNATLDEFATDWIEALSCLCRLCAEVEGFTDQAEKDYFIAQIDPKLDALYADVLAETSTTGESTYGSKIPTDNCVLVQDAIWLMASLTTASASVTAGMATWLTGKLAAFDNDYGQTPPPTQRFRQSAVGPYIGVMCDGAAANGTCGAWVDVLDCLDQLIKRRAYLPESVVTAIVDDFNQLLMDMFNGFSTTYNDFPAWPDLDTDIENVAFSVTFMLRHIYDDCLRGWPVDPALVLNLSPADIATLQTNYTALLARLAALDVSERVDLCVTPRTELSTRQRRLIEDYRKLCNTPPTETQLQSAPYSSVVQKLTNAASLFDEVTGALDLEPIPHAWPLADFTKIVAQVVRTLVIAYGSTDKFSPALEKRMNTFETDFTTATAACPGSAAATAGVQTTCDDFLTMLLCLANVCRYRDFLPAAVFTGPNSLEDRLGAHLRDLVKKSWEWGESLGLETMPNRSTANRCRKLRTIANYFGAHAGNYTELSSIKSLFDDNDALITALGTGLTGARGRYCPEPSDGAYDPLMKRLRVDAGDLASTVAYGTNGEPAIDRIVIAPVGACTGGAPCASYLLKVCWLSEEEADYNTDLPDKDVVQELNNSMIYMLNKTTQPLWRPDTRYAVRMTTTEWIGDVGAKRGYRRTHFFGFRTRGPIGHFHLEGPAEVPTFTHPQYQLLTIAKKEETYQYTGLKQYIDYQRSYPNADGNLIGAKPLYYEGSKLLVFYTKDYMFSMFGQWSTYNGMPQVDSGLKFVLRDPSVAQGAAGISIEPIWKKDPNPPMPPDRRVFEYILTNVGEDCITASPLEQLNPTPPAHNAEVQFKLTLAPSRLYTAILYSVVSKGTDPAEERQVHKYVFQTSRYIGFREHIESYKLDDTATPKKAVYSVEIAEADADMALAVLANQRPADPTAAQRYDDLQLQYGDALERILDGAMRLGTMERPATTEFVILAKQVGAVRTVLGVLLRSPEPFNDSKLPAEELAAGLGVNLDGHVKMFAKDVTRVLVTTPNLTFPTGARNFTFTYRLFDGTGYGVAVMTRRMENVPDEWEEFEVPSVIATIQIE